MNVNVQTAEQPDSRRWWALIAAALGIFMVALDMNILNVALPSMAAQFGVSDQIAWVALSYTLAGIAVITVAGRLSDLIGQKKIILWGIAIFLFGSVLCGTAATLWQMVLYRVIQGVGGAFIAAPIAAVATVLFPAHERGKAMGVVGIVGPLGGIAGPSLGGVLTDIWGWSWVFYINIPAAIVSFLLLWRLLPDDTAFRKVKFDLIGTLILSAGSFAVLFGLSSESQDGIVSSQLMLLIAGAALFIIFPFVENKVEQPIIPMAILKKAAYSFPLIGILASSIAGSGLGFLNAFFLQQEMGLTATETGVTVLFFPLAMVAAAQIGGAISDRLGPKVSAGAGAAINILGMILFSPLHPDWSMAEVMGLMFVMGFGHGLFVSPANVAIMAATPRQFLGVSSAVSNMFRSLGFALGPAIAAFVWTPGADNSISSMQTVVYLMIAVQIVTLITTFRYIKGK